MLYLGGIRVFGVNIGSEVALLVCVLVLIYLPFGLRKIRKHTATKDETPWSYLGDPQKQGLFWLGLTIGFIGVFIGIAISKQMIFLGIILVLISGVIGAKIKSGMLMFLCVSNIMSLVWLIMNLDKIDRLLR